MTNEKAERIVTEYEKSGILPIGYTADVSAPRTTVQGDTYEVVQLIQDNIVRISYTRKNGQPEEVAVV